MIYIHNNDLTDIASFKTGLQEHYPVTDIARATWIKTREVTTIPPLVNFSTAELPEYLRITGKCILALVYPYNERPMQCKNCQKYSHTKKRCTSESAICGWCAGQHSTAECNREETPAKCIDCEGPHSAYAVECPARQREVKIMEIQQNRKITQRQAIEMADGKKGKEITRQTRKIGPALA